MEKFYRWLLSSEWSERLKAYAYIETDLRLRDCYVLNDDKWNDMKMLVGQILSIHFKLRHHMIIGRIIVSLHYTEHQRCRTHHPAGFTQTSQSCSEG